MTATSQSVDLDRRGRVAVLTVNNPPVNALSQHVRQGLRDGLKQAAADAGVAAIVIACAGRTFIAGADITEFGKPPREPGLHEVLDLIESSPKPVVAAIHGTALGGGLEVTLACHYRVGVKTARFGLPEVKLGLLPGAGGTQRLPRVVGVPEGAVDDRERRPDRRGRGAEGRPDRRDRRRRPHRGGRGLRGEDRGREAAAQEDPRPRRQDRGGRAASPRSSRSSASRWRARRAASGRPRTASRPSRRRSNLPFDQGLKRERELFQELITSPESKAQRYFFFAEREAAKIPDVPADTPSREIKKAAVHRRRHHGRRHRHELRQRRHPGDGGRGGPGGARPRPRRRAQELRGHRHPRPAHRCRTSRSAWG